MWKNKDQSNSEYGHFLRSADGIYQFETWSLRLNNILVGFSIIFVAVFHSLIFVTNTVGTAEYPGDAYFNV